jgi:hypothetical protein
MDGFKSRNREEVCMFYYFCFVCLSLEKKKEWKELYESYTTDRQTAGRIFHSSWTGYGRWACFFMNHHTIPHSRSSARRSRPRGRRKKTTRQRMQPRVQAVTEPSPLFPTIQQASVSDLTVHWVICDIESIDQTPLNSPTGILLLSADTNLQSHHSEPLASALANMDRLTASQHPKAYAYGNSPRPLVQPHFG